MHSGFWGKLKRPILALAPMANVTDAAFRRVIAKYGKPDIMWTEFVSVDGLLSRGKEKLLPDLWFTEAERPIVAQVFGGKPELFAPVAKLVRELGFDGLDINMGCPDRAVEKQGAGAALIKEPEVAKKIISEAIKGAGGMPVSVKTRIGYKKENLKEWLPVLLGSGIAGLTVHLRTREEMSNVAAHWELVKTISELRDEYSPQVRLLCNGDVKSRADAEEKINKYDIDGVMIGRGIFGTPWFFRHGADPSVPEKLRIMLEHTRVFEELYKSDKPYHEGALKNFDLMKKHYKAYVSGFDGAKELRIKLMSAENYKEAEELTESFLKSAIL